MDQHYIKIMPSHLFIMNLSYFELCQARKWAMELLKTHNVRIRLDVSNVNQSSRWFIMNEISESWHGRVQDDYIEFYKEETDHTNVYIRTFEQDKSLFFGLYDTNGLRLCPICLVIYNRKYPEVSNQGYAPGRCPDSM